jgi:hypothetical protein
MAVVVDGTVKGDAQVPHKGPTKKEERSRASEVAIVFDRYENPPEFWVFVLVGEVRVVLNSVLFDGVNRKFKNGQWARRCFAIK